jgi:hypothetical protein
LIGAEMCIRSEEIGSCVKEWENLSPKLELYQVTDERLFIISSGMESVRRKIMENTKRGISQPCT